MAEPEPICNQDAMLVFDASGSMSGEDWGYGSESANTVTRIERVRAALAKVLPGITRYRRVGLVTRPARGKRRRWRAADPTNYSKKLYDRALQPLVRFHSADPDIFFVYTMVKWDGVPYFVLDTASSQLRTKQVSDSAMRD
jgi:hypothetical protein